jgi:hypothetical protein
MDPTPIAELNPELPERDSIHFKAAVTLIWPFSSSQRNFALLLAEPDFRLRRKKGQVRARFSGSSARALATTGVGIGDEVVLSLRGAQFVKEGTVSTPGRSIDWELEYTQTVAVRILRDGNELANLEILDVAPTPAPRSPVRRQTNMSHSFVEQWSSPAFLKRARLSDGPFFEAPYDPLAADNDDGHDGKRRRKSYRDWKAWTYNARTPSPEKEDVDIEDDSDNMDVSPTRRAQLPHTPDSPHKADLLTVAAGPLHATTAAAQPPETDPALETVPEDTYDRAISSGKTMQLPETADFVRDDEYYDLYAGPDEIRPADAEYAFGGDTEANTEEDDELEDTDAVSMSPTEVDTEEMEELPEDHSPRAISYQSELGSRALFDADAGSTTEEGSLVEPSDIPNTAEALIDNVEADNAQTAELEFLEIVEEAPTIIMPPPTLPTLNTEIPAPITPGILTPIGKEPASPTLQPLDSALLPLPSPFPGERDVNITSYFDHLPTGEVSVEPGVEGEELPSDASYILENSFFSSINSSKAPASHPDHESAFTPVRFTFGMDGAGLSRPLQLSSPAPEQPTEESDKNAQSNMEHAVSNILQSAPDVTSHQPAVDHSLLDRVEIGVPPFTTEVAASATTAHKSNKTNDREEFPVTSNPFEVKETEPEVIELSSDSDEEDSESEASEMDVESEADDDEAIDPVDDLLEPTIDESGEANTTLDSDHFLPQNHVNSTTTRHSTAVLEVVDLDSPSESSDVEGPVSPSPGLNANDAVELEVVTAPHAPSITQDQSRPEDDPSFVLDHPESHSELSAMDFVHANFDLPANTPEIATTHPTMQQEPQGMIAPGQEDHSMVTDEHGLSSVMDNLDTIMGDFLHDEHLDVAQWEATDLDEHHPDIKLESIEEQPVFQAHEPDAELREDIDRTTASPPGEILIDIPEEGHKLGELHTVSVPATGPARNTRSKTKASVSPVMERVSPPKRNTRSTRSKASMTPIVQTAMSPSRTQTRSTMSPTSPYSLRSQSKLLSPTQGTTMGAATTRRSPRKHASQRDADFIPDISSSQLHDADPFVTSFQPSQELGASQGRFSNVGFVKDSEEESLHSEQSLSTVKYSDDWNTFTNFSDPPVENEQTYNIDPPPASAPEAGTKRRGKQVQRQAVVSNQNTPTEVGFSFTTHASLDSPRRKLRSASSMEMSPNNSPRVRRTTRQPVHILSSPSQRSSDEATPRTTERLEYPTLPGESQSSELKSSPPRSTIVDVEIRRSPPAAAATLPTFDPQSIISKNRPVTPEATQRTNMESQKSVVPSQQKQSLLMTPQLTQATSAGLQSFEESTANATTLVGTPSKRSPSVVIRSTPRRNATQTDVASPSVTPKEHSPEVSSDSEVTAVESSQGPSIGLSTPLAYYTALKSLTYFLNRSSQFHTSSNPDVLALVTSATTSPQRATKGRKDWTTTLHITDASTWPSTTTVNIFRPYQAALPTADAGDIVLLGAFAVKSLNRHPSLTSADESSWCVWRYGKPVWGVKRGAYAETKAREEVKGPAVERGEGEWREVEKLRTWWVDKVKREMEEKVHTRSMDKQEDRGEGVQTRSRDKGKGKGSFGAEDGDEMA